LDLALSDGFITASTVKEVGTDYFSLIDAKVRIRGNQAPLFNAQNVMTDSYLLLPDRAQVMVEEPAPVRPFTLVENATRTSPAVASARICRENTSVKSKSLPMQVRTDGSEPRQMAAKGLRLFL
jgi:hypothetical protein